MNTKHLLMMMVACAGMLPSFGQTPKLKPLDEKELLEELKPQEKKGSWGYANAEGKFLIKNHFSEARPFAKERAIVRYGNKYGLLDKTGVFLLEPTYDEMRDFHGIYSIVRLNGLYGTIGLDGKPITEPQFDACKYRRGFNILLVTKNGVTGAIERDGKVSVEPCFTTIDDVKDGVAIVLKDGRMGAVDKNLKTMVEPKYDFLEYSGAGNFFAKLDGKVGIVSYLGEEKTPIEYDNLMYQEVGKFCISERDGRYGVISPTNTEVLAPVLQMKPTLHAGNNLILQDDRLFLVSERGASWWCVDQHFDLSDGESAAISDTLSLQALPLGTEMQLIYHEHTPLFITKAGRVLWAINAGVREWAERPVDYDLDCENVSRKGYMTAVNAAGKPVQIEQSFDLLWPVAAKDPRVDVALCQQGLIKCMAKSLYGETADLSFENIDEFLTYATTHACFSDGLKNVRSVPKPKGKNMNEGGYTMLYTGNFVGDKSLSDAAYDFHPNIDKYGVNFQQNKPNYVHFNKETGDPFKLDDRYSRTAQAKIVNMIRGGNVICDTPEEKETFLSVKEACADIDDENFYSKGDTVYFYKRPFSSCPPMHIGVRQPRDVLAGSGAARRQLYTEYVFNSHDLKFMDLRDHVEKVTIQTAAESHTYRFNIKGELVEIDGYDPFAATLEEGQVRMERDKNGHLKNSDASVESSSAYQYLEYDKHGNWIRRKLKQVDDAVEETRTITYFN